MNKITLGGSCCRLPWAGSGRPWTRADCKTYALLIVGRSLQVAAVASMVGAVVAAGVWADAILVTAILPACALGALGTKVASYSRPKIAPLPVHAPPSQSLAGNLLPGLKNGGNNCWINASLQLLARVPAYAARLRQVPEGKQFLDHRATAQRQSTVSDFDSNVIRQLLQRKTATTGIDALNGEACQEDPARLFEYLFEGNRGLHAFETFLGGVPSRARREPMIQIELEARGTLQRFDGLLSRFFHYFDDVNQLHQLFFSQAPQNLLIQFKRFYRDSSGGMGKIQDPISVQEQMQMPARFVRSGKSASYRCDAFIVHEGPSLIGGHYVAYIRTGGLWWYCSDSLVMPVTSEEAQARMQESYIIHYAKEA